MADARGLGGLFVAAGPPLRQPPLARSLCCRLMASALKSVCARVGHRARRLCRLFACSVPAAPACAVGVVAGAKKPARPRPGVAAPPLWPRPAGTPGQASAGGPFGRLPPSHFVVSVAVGSSGATPPPPPRRPVSPAAIKAEWGGLASAKPRPFGPRRGAPAPPPILGPRGGAFFSFAAAGIDIVAEATPGHYMLWCFICNTSQYRRPGT